eukprot:CAMPEP_0168183684 /NCGR_PEP_ID=MMETSP0139_2-20121125/12737_1 /TAXON_ID=44445 /ORGANISM="Pseudo-nitzschia australis, Strain 10249 10 AB" /LENGTH=235 /DNA_ID=CAMNT_0008105055 /DNA_START=186 /DNA_END=893 /DNA_ORIENTATION=-
MNATKRRTTLTVLYTFLVVLSAAPLASSLQPRISFFASSPRLPEGNARRSASPAKKPTQPHCDAQTELAASASTDGASSSSGRRKFLANAAGVAWMAMAADGALPVPAQAATTTESTSTSSSTNGITATKKSNYNYDLGSSDCQAACARNCELQNKKLNNNNDTLGNGTGRNCLDACVRSGQRYCHQMTSTSNSPSDSKASTSRYLTTTQEPAIRSSKPIPGLKYNSNRGGAWRD